MLESTLKTFFKHHPPTKEDAEKYEAIRTGALVFARIINENCPETADKTVAIRAVREAVMWANASIALDGK